ncbi:MAG: hypothetical protein IKX40_07640 [Thermoguttaceae bacterium]|nr:hypothetical protein [Thermoguttaceae bacterium]
MNASFAARTLGDNSLQPRTHARDELWRERIFKPRPVLLRKFLQCGVVLACIRRQAKNAKQTFAFSFSISP